MNKNTRALACFLMGLVFIGLPAYVWSTLKVNLSELDGAAKTMVFLVAATFVVGAAGLWARAVQLWTNSNRQDVK